MNRFLKGIPKNPVFYLGAVTLIFCSWFLCTYTFQRFITQNDTGEIIDGDKLTVVEFIDSECVSIIFYFESVRILYIDVNAARYIEDGKLKRGESSVKKFTVSSQVFLQILGELNKRDWHFCRARVPYYYPQCWVKDSWIGRRWPFTDWSEEDVKNAERKMWSIFLKGTWLQYSLFLGIFVCIAYLFFCLIVKYWHSPPPGIVSTITQ